jgi:predicted Rossmann-fold nucleotide-binding protein
MRICVFCGSSSGNDPAFVVATRSTGKVLVEQEIELVYGGGRVGLMGAVADAVLVAGGRATGMMPRALTGDRPSRVDEAPHCRHDA